MPVRYSIASMILHWTMAAVIVGAWLAGQFIEDAPRGAERVFVTGVHALLGLTILALVLPRLAARFIGGVPDDHAAPAWQRRAGQAAHLVLYALMLALPLVGLAILISGRAPFVVLGTLTVPNWLAGAGLRKTFEEVHALLADGLLVVVGLHVAATLWHLLVKRDGVAARMIPGAVISPAPRPGSPSSPR